MKGLLKNLGLILVLVGAVILVSCSFTGNVNNNTLLGTSAVLMVLGLISYIIINKKLAVRVLILSARSQLSDKVAGLDLGADDYLTKPFALEELEARVRTLLRREFRQRESLVQVGALTLNTVTREVSGRGEPLPLTPREFAILEHLMLHRGCWISQEELMEHIWEADANPFSNAVRMHISSLRKKLRKRLGHDPIQTKVGRGYRLAGEETA